MEEEREKGSCPFPCSLSSLLSMNCRARAQGLSHPLQTQVRYKTQPGLEGTMLVGSDGKVRLASTDSRTYSLDDYNLESLHRNSELKNLRPIHVVTSEPTLHLCFPSQPVLKEDQLSKEQEQDSDVYFDFDLITPPEDYACTRDSEVQAQETRAEENENTERPESGCVTSVTSPIMFSIDIDLPPSNPSSPVDDCGLDDANSKASDIDLETVRQILVSSQNKTSNSESSQDKQFVITKSDIPDFIGVVKCSNYPKTSSYSDNATSSSSDCDSSSETGFNIPEEEKELISKDKNMSRNMSYYLPPPSSYQIFRNKESDMDVKQIPSTAKSKHKTLKVKHKKKKLKSHSSNRNESSESRDSPLLTPEFGIRLSSSPESSSIQSNNVSEKNNLSRKLIIRSNSFNHLPKSSVNKKIKTSHSFEKCAFDNVSYSDKDALRSIKQFSQIVYNQHQNNSKLDNCSNEHDIQLCEETNKITSNAYITNSKYGENTLNELSSDDIKAILEIEGGKTVSPLNEEDILKEINEAIAILKNEYDDSIDEKLAKYENKDVDALGIVANKKETCLEQVAVLSQNSAAHKCQKFIPVSQLCEVCEEVPYIAPIFVKEGKCDNNIKHKFKRFSSYDNTFQANYLSDSTFDREMPRSKGRSKVKKANSETLSPQRHDEVELPGDAIFPIDPTSSSIPNKANNLECTKLNKKDDFSILGEESVLNNNYNSVSELRYKNRENGECECCDVEVKIYNSDVLCENISEKNGAVSVKETNKDRCELSSIMSKNNISENGHFNESNEYSNCAAVGGIVDSILYEKVHKESCETLNVNELACESLVEVETLISFDCPNSVPVHNFKNNNNNNLIDFGAKIICSNYVSSDSNLHSNGKLNEMKNNLERNDFPSVSGLNTDNKTPPKFNDHSRKKSSPQNNHKYLNENNSQNFMCTTENQSTDTKTTTTNEAESEILLPMLDSVSPVMNPGIGGTTSCGEKSETINVIENINESEIYIEDVFNDEIELLPSDNCETKTNEGKEVEEESDEEIIVSSRFRKISAYTERITRLSEDDDDGLPPPPTEVILIDYNEPIENHEEEMSEEKNISADLASELNKLSIAEPTVEGPSDESERSSEEREIDGELQQKIKRSSSLRCGKTPPGTPGRKKIVRFADALGLDLADIRTYLDGVPTVPPSAFCDLQVEGEGSNVSSSESRQNIPSYGSYTAAASAAAAILQTQAQRILTPMFQQPGALPDFYTRLREQKVVLENVSVGNDLSVKGVVRVINEDFHKKVYIRYTFDHWRNYHEATATYLDGSCDGFSDRFSFLLWGSFLQSNGSLVFCVKYCVNNNKYWDNNRGSNYVLQCYSAPPAHSLQGKPQNDVNLQQHQEEQNPRHRQSHQSGLSGRSAINFSSFLDSPNTPTDPWATKFF